MPTFHPIGRNGLDAVRQYLDRIPDDGKRRDVAITLRRERRSIPANRLYWMWIGVIADELGYNRDELHEVFKLKFLGAKTVEIGGTEQTIPLSTASLDTAQFTDFLNRLEAWVTSELGIILPHPEDVFWIEFEQEYGA